MVVHLFSSNSCLLVFLIAVAIVDVATRRIPNLLTVSAAVAGLILNFSQAGSYGALMGSAGLLTGLAAFMPFYLAKGFGAGDVKAMAAVGAFLGPQGALLAAAWTLAAGAVGAVLLLIVRGEHTALRALAGRWLWRGYSMYCAGRPVPLVARLDDPTRRRFPYGVAIAFGTVLSLAWS